MSENIKIVWYLDGGDSCQFLRGQLPPLLGYFKFSLVGMQAQNKYNINHLLI